MDGRGRHVGHSVRHHQRHPERGQLGSRRFFLQGGADHSPVEALKAPADPARHAHLQALGGTADAELRDVIPAEVLPHAASRRALDRVHLVPGASHPGTGLLRRPEHVRSVHVSVLLHGRQAGERGPGG